MAATGDESAKRARLGDDRGTDAEHAGVVGDHDGRRARGSGGRRATTGASVVLGAAAEDLLAVYHAIMCDHSW